MQCLKEIKRIFRSVLSACILLGGLGSLSSICCDVTLVRISSDCMSFVCCYGYMRLQWFNIVHLFSMLGACMKCLAVLVDKQTLAVTYVCEIVICAQDPSNVDHLETTVRECGRHLKQTLLWSTFILRRSGCNAWSCVASHWSIHQANAMDSFGI